jgi:hypothetical protein
MTDHRIITSISYADAQATFAYHGGPRDGEPCGLAATLDLLIVFHSAADEIRRLTGKEVADLVDGMRAYVGPVEAPADIVDGIRRYLEPEFDEPEFDGPSCERRHVQPPATCECDETSGHIGP